MILPGCINDTCEESATYLTLQPEYMSYEEFRSAFATETARTLEYPGKLYFKGGYIFISEVNQGIHIIDNSNPEAPQNIAFLNIPGNHDLAIKGNFLYADSHVDLLTIDISNPLEATLIQRDEDVFPYQQEFQGFWADQTQGVVKNWKEVEVTDTYDCSNGLGFPSPFWRNQIAIDFASADVAFPESGALGEIPAGIGGSMARFTLMNNYLYTVTQNDLLVFNIDQLESPRNVNSVNIGWQIETIFPFKNHLLIGSQNGMFIYDTQSPESPSQVSEFWHMRSCDPVVAEGDFAYVTLRSGTTCPGGNNQLDIIDISDLSSPSLLTTYRMSNPHGLGIRNDVLFICEGEEGLKVFDTSKIRSRESTSLPLIAHFQNIHAFDVIPLFDILLMIGDDGFYQYDYSDLENIRLMSVIPVVKG